MEKNRIFEFNDYKEYLLGRIEALPKGGRGQLQNLAKSLRVHPTLVSQVLRGSKHFTSEQVLMVADFFGLNELESDYLLGLVELERAGNQQLKKYWSRRIEQMRFQARQLHKAEAPAQWTDEQKTEFYSSWEYSAVRVSTGLDSMKTPYDISERLGLPLKRVNEILAFLLAAGLCIEKDGRITFGPTWTHIPFESPLASRHHLNWRLKGLQAHRNIKEDEFAFTYVLTIGLKDRAEVRKILKDSLEKIKKLVEQSGSDELCCLNIDWFNVRKESSDVS